MARDAAELAQDDPRNPLARPWKRIMEKPFMAGIVVFALIVLGAGGFFAWQWVNTNGLPRESAVVVAAEDTGETVNCGGRWGRNDKPIYEVTYESSRPPSGLASTFVKVEGCGAPDLGDRRTIVRTSNADGTLKVWIDPPKTLWQALWGPLCIGFAAGAFVIGLQRLDTVLGWRSARIGRGRHGETRGHGETR